MNTRQIIEANQARETNQKTTPVSYGNSRHSNIF
jgi:hypothetical protein